MKKRKKICLINPSRIDENKNASPLSTRNKYFINPYNLAHIGLGYIAAVLKDNDFECDIIELPVENCSINEIVKRIIENKYTFVGISTYYYNIFNTMRIVKKLKASELNPFIVLGGFLPTLAYDELLKSGIEIDCCSIGEGEYTILELAQAISNNENWKSIDGLAYLEDGKVIRTKPRKLIDDLDVLPFPIRPFVRDRRIAAIVISRGCYGHCTYCGIREFMDQCDGRCYRRRSPQNVVQEIEELVNEHHVKYIVINDGVFHFASAKGKQWFDEFETLILKKGINVSFLCDLRADEIAREPEFLKRFKKIGLYNVNVGIESFVQKHLDFYQKSITVSQNIKAIKAIEKEEINYTIGILIFNPITTIEDIINFCEVMEKNNFYEKIYSVIRPLSVGSRVIATTGTKMYEYVKENGLYEDNIYNYKFLDSRVEIVYMIIERWSEKVSEIFNLNYLSYITQERNMLKEDTEIRKLIRELYFIDRAFIKETCRKKLDGEIETIAKGEELISAWKSKLDKVYDKLKQYELQLREFY